MEKKANVVSDIAREDGDIGVVAAIGGRAWLLYDGQGVLEVGSGWAAVGGVDVDGRQLAVVE
eukprot:CAMPEP_0202017316 /NCGR_PEP_ID=MMETSP0905-20130828/36678_1 /ASSEMBLY_ACC=CAM_ASM_000554 /TAXON_ID=420261 /ORGANISM="Thalassiosira antarctica, Strain CCMP982" /LENGTH=61 /DNA_ID=CAMNT_0048577941 /DNA_START=53 /DNA_END=236 /DNA_ORIENTATION=+